MAGPGVASQTFSPASGSVSGATTSGGKPRPRALVVRTAGTNCDAEMCRGFELGGAAVELIHVDRLIADPGQIDRFELIGFPGGFSYGDDIASGRILAVRIKQHLYPQLRAAARRGCPMIAACNGFQVLVQTGLLPGPAGGEGWPEDRTPQQEVALTFNSGGRFVDTWVGVKYEPASVCVWTKGLAEIGGEHAADVSLLPIAHGEGRFATAEAGVLKRLEAAGQIAVRYTDNPNGSEGHVAGICDATGRIFGLMPHPERYLQWNRHPYWTRIDPSVRSGDTPGVRMFRNAVEAAVAVR